MRTDLTAEIFDAPHDLWLRMFDSMEAGLFPNTGSYVRLNTYTSARTLLSDSLFLDDY